MRGSKRPGPVPRHSQLYPPSPEELRRLACRPRFRKEIAYRAKQEAEEVRSGWSEHLWIGVAVHDIVADLHQHRSDMAEATTALLKLRISGKNASRLGRLDH